jgi:hypothetical protein
VSAEAEIGHKKPTNNIGISVLAGASSLNLPLPSAGIGSLVAAETTSRKTETSPADKVESVGPSEGDSFMLRVRHE